MRCLAPFGALAIVMGCGLSAQEHAESIPAPLEQTEIIHLEREAHERLTVSVMIGAAGPFRFLIDTGAQATVLSRELADKLGLMERRPVTLIGMASQVATETVMLDDLAIGQRRTRIARAPLVEAQHLGDADGVLGIDALQGQRVLIDFVDRRMAIATKEDGQDRSGYDIVVRAHRRNGQLILADASIEGIRTVFVIDTGAQVSVGNMALARRLRARQAEATELFDINGAVAKGHLHVATKVKIGSMELQRLPIMFTPSPAFAALDLESRPAMILGMRELRLFQRIAIDFDTRRVLFDLPSTDSEMIAALSRFQGY